LAGDRATLLIQRSWDKVAAPAINHEPELIHPELAEAVMATLSALALEHAPTPN